LGFQVQRRGDEQKNNMNNSTVRVAIFATLLLFIPACHKPEERHHENPHKVVVTMPVAKDIVLTQQYVCQIHSSRHIEVKALESGYLEQIPVREGQAVKEGDTMFTVLPVLYQAKLDTEIAEVQLAQIEYNNTERLFQQNVVAKPEVALAQAKLAKAQSKLNMAKAELNFATIRAPFDGIIDQQRHQQGSLIEEGDVLTTLSDNRVMWVYFNVPEARYLEYIASPNKEELKIELMLADGSKFSESGSIGAVEADFNNETGNIAFRADFPNPNGLLRHGQTGTVLMSRVVKDAIVIPQRATFEILAKKYAFVVTDHNEGDDDEDEHESDEHHTSIGSKSTHGDHEAEPDDEGEEDDDDDDADHDEDGEESESSQQHGVVHQREIVILKELDDIYLIKDGLKVDEKIILEGIRQVRDGGKVNYEFLAPDEALGHLKYHAE